MPVTVRTDVDLDEPHLVEGMPGLGLASKIAVDHLVEALDMTYHASVTTEGIPEVTMFEPDDRTLRPPVRIFASAEHDLLALTSDVLVSPIYAPEFASTVVGWLADNGVTPLFLSGLPAEADEHDLFGVATGDAASMLADRDIPAPDGPGLIGGPTGALLQEADEHGMDALGLVVESDPQFPDPTAARVLIDQGVEPLTGIDVDTDVLTEKAEQIREQKEQFAEMIQQAEHHERSQAFPEGMYQ